MKIDRFENSRGDLCEAVVMQATPDSIIYSQSPNLSDTAAMESMYNWWPFKPVAVPHPRERADSSDFPLISSDGTLLWSRRAQIGAVAKWPLPADEIVAKRLNEKLKLTISTGDKLLPIGPLVRPRTISQGCTEVNKMFVNGGFFLSDHTEPRGPSDAFGDPIGLIVNDGIIENPPLYARGGFVVRDGVVTFERYSRNDLMILLPRHNAVRADNTDPNVSVLVHGVDENLGRTPPGDVYEVAVQMRHAVYAKVGGNMQIPKAGFVMRWKEKPNASVIDSLCDGAEVSYQIPRLNGAKTALQVGPLLMDNGRSLLAGYSFTQEEFINHAKVSLPPEPFPSDAGFSRAGRMAIALDKDRVSHLIAIRGASGTVAKRQGEHVATGLTLIDLEGNLRKMGFVAALNLDGGASSQIFMSAGAMVFESRHIGGRTFGVYERPVSNVISCKCGEWQ